VKKELNFLMISSCFQSKNRNLNASFFAEIKYLWEEQSNTLDIPVIKEGVTYKNVFCFICNEDIDIKNDFSGEE
jgi:hypothetical protein